MWRGTLLAAGAALAGGIVAPAAHAATSAPGAAAGPERATPAATTGATKPTGRPPARHQPPVEATLVLDHMSVRAGTSIKGTWRFTDTTAHPILVDACAQDIWQGAWLQSTQLPAITEEPGTPVVKCRPDVSLAPGVNRFPVTVPTFYDSCSPLQAGDRTRTPTCRPTGLPPPLPPGTYVTKYLIRGMPAGFHQPAPLTVTLRAARDLPAGSGYVVGTATPCVGQAVVDGVPQTWTVQVTLRRGAGVVGHRVLTDTWRGSGPMVDQPFTFVEPAGSYTLAAGSGGTAPVTVRPGRTTVVTLPDRCA